MAKGSLLLGILVGALMSMTLVTLLLLIQAGPLLAVLISGVVAGYIAGSLSKGALVGLVSGALGPLFSLGLVSVFFRALIQRFSELLSVNMPPSFITLALVLVTILLVLIGGLVGLIGGVIGGATRKFAEARSKVQRAEAELPPPPP